MLSVLTKYKYPAISRFLHFAALQSKRRVGVVISSETK